MASAEEMKARIDCADLAERLGMEKPPGQPNYRSPHRKDENPSVSIFEHKNLGISYWKDHTSGEHGSCIDLVIYVEGGDPSEALRQLHEIYSIPFDKSDDESNRRSKMDWVADKCLADIKPAETYLIDERKIPKPVVGYLAKRKTIGYNDWINPEKKEGEKGHNGPAACFISRSLHTLGVLGIEYRFLDPVKNGGLKTKSQGEKENAPYFPDLPGLRNAEVVFVVEAPINAVSVLAAFDPEGKGTSTRSAMATRGVAVVDSIDWSVLQGKTAVVCMDNDKPDEKGRRPGQEAAWKIHEHLTALNIPCHFVDQSEWGDINDVNDYLKAHGPNVTRTALRKLEPWLIPGLHGRDDDNAPPYRRRLLLPTHDFAVYWQFRAKPDFTSYSKITTDQDTGDEKIVHQDLCGFRVASLSRVTISSATAAMSGETDSQPHTVFACSVQTARHGDRLMRKVLQDDQLHNVEQWKKFGPVFKPAQFARMLNILERAVGIGSRDAVNFVGLAWRDGRPVINEGADCYFTEPDKQCPYHNLAFPSGPVTDAEKVITAYQSTFKDNAALMLLVWSLGSHLKAFLGAWPHMMLQADKGAGKSTLIKRLERSIAFTMFSGQSLKTEFRLLTSISHTSHPVGWEELSAQGQGIIDKAVAQLQECYQYTITRRGTDMTEYLAVAPVLLAGEDVPVNSLLGKLVRTDLSGRRGPLMPENLPRFPVREWLQYLARLDRARVQSAYVNAQSYCEQHFVGSGEDDGANRMRNNYAYILMAWMFLCEFADMPQNFGHFKTTLIAEMNSHIAETSSDRAPWVWILELILGEIDSGNYRYPYAFTMVDDEFCLCIRTSHIMQHLSQTPALRPKYDALPVKSDRVLKKQLIKAEVVTKEPVEKTINTKRVANMVALSLNNLKAFGLTPAVPDMPTSSTDSASAA